VQHFINVFIEIVALSISGSQLLPFHFPLVPLERGVVPFVLSAAIDNRQNRKTEEEVPVLRHEKRHTDTYQAEQESQQAGTLFRNPFPNHMAPMQLVMRLQYTSICEHNCFPARLSHGLSTRAADPGMSP
jgi:hypothetical protein